MLMPSIFGESLFGDFFNFPFFGDKEQEKLERKLYGHRGESLMKTDIRETDSGHELGMDLPGLAKSEVEVSLKDSTLTINASKGFDQNEQEKKTGRYTRRERYAGTCERSFYVGENFTETDTKGEFKHGILKLFVSKKKAEPAIEEKKYATIE